MPKRRRCRSTYLTAALALYRMAALNVGETVLVHNAGGGGRHCRDAARQAAPRDGHRHCLGDETRRAADLRRRSCHRLPHRGRGEGDRADHPRPRRRRDPRPDRRPELHHQLPDAGAAGPAGDLRSLVRRARRAPQLVARLPCVGRHAALQPALAHQSQPRRLRPAPRPPVGRTHAASRRSSNSWSASSRPGASPRSSRARSRSTTSPTRTASSSNAATSARLYLTVSRS